MGAEQIRELFLLDPSVTFLNHGSFGACPKPVFSEYQRWQLELERQPVEFLGRRADDLLLEARQRLGAYLNVPADTLVFVTNATAGVNTVIRSLDLEPDDEVLTTNHEYGACTMSWDWLLGKVGARLVKHEIPTPVVEPEELVESFLSSVTDRTKAIYLSHITSPTALILPVQQICSRAREMGILTIIDGAHAPGQIALDLEALGADIYTGNLHKWLCAPKGAGFLYVRPEEQAWIESLIVSWGWGRSGTLGDSTFVERNQWQGTRDIAAWLAVPAAIDFQEQNHWPDIRSRCHQLAVEARVRINQLSGIPPLSPDSSDWFAQMVSCPVPATDAKALQNTLYANYRIEVPVVDWQGQALVRTSFQAYNDTDDLDKLMLALETIL